MTLKAFVFDLDGTLLDTNKIHVEAWRRTFARFGFDIEAERIAPEIGRDGEGLLNAILGDEVDDDTKEKLRDESKKDVQRVLNEQSPLRVYSGVRELFAELRSRNLQLALATAASEDDLDALLEGSDFNAHELFDVVTNSDDADEGKPAPELLQSTCEQLGIAPQNCAYIGDAIWDAKAASRAGLFAVGVLEGAHADEAALREAGMQRVYPDIRALLDDLDNILATAPDEQQKKSD